MQHVCVRACVYVRAHTHAVSKLRLTRVLISCVWKLSVMTNVFIGKQPAAPRAYFGRGG